MQALLTALLVTMAAAAVFAGSTWANGAAVTIDTRMGKMVGLELTESLHFRGVRYAEPPTGLRRFMPPTSPDRWSGTYDATAFPNRCVEPSGGLGTSVGRPDEDCLFLNIVTPAADDKRRPVLFWIHGGGFTQGSANDYDGSVLARQGEVVVVTINYRLGLLGFANLETLGSQFTGSANNGIRDQIHALRWVRDNIGDFGGDPTNVTIFGESAGGASIHALLAAPSADGLYHKAIAHSPMQSNLVAQDHVPTLSSQLGVDRDELLDQLRVTSTDTALKLQAVVSPGGGRIDGTVITRSTNQAILDRGANGVPLIAGTNRDEGTFFTMLIPQPIWETLGPGIARTVTSGEDPTPYLRALETIYPNETDKQRHERVWTDMFRHSAIGNAQRATAAGPGGWLYRFDLPATTRMGGQELGATHAAEIPFTFNVFAGTNSTSRFYDASDPVVKDLAQRWSNTIIAFARTGDPNGAGLPHWPRYSESSRRTLILDGNPRVEKDVDQKQRKLWESVGAPP